MLSLTFLLSGGLSAPSSHALQNAQVVHADDNGATGNLRRFR
ncbi:hypothetical protein [Planomonospora sp. ID67723]|nr:hypothetical protein [Planomonospora sp. ID67723]